MSFSFYVRAESPPRFSVVVDALAEPDWACEGPEDDRFTDDFFVHPYLVGRSARGIELGLDGGSMQVRILTCSSRADYELALHLVDTLARLLKGDITPEGADAMPREQIRATYDGRWIDHMVAAGPDAVLAMARKGSTVTLMGAKRPFYAGPRLVAALMASGEAGVGERLLDAMVNVQNVDEDAYYTASALVIRPKASAGGKENVTLGTWGPDVAYLFPNVEYFALVVPEGGYVLVPSSSGPTIAGAKWTFLDEKNALVEATPAAEWPALLARARPFATELG